MLRMDLRDGRRATPASVTFVLVLCSFAVSGHAQQTPPSPGPSFAVVSIKRSPSLQGGRTSVLPGGRYLATNIPIALVAIRAYDLPSVDRVIGGPSWLQRDHYDIDARAEGVDKLSSEQVSSMLRQLLADRFNFRGRVEARPRPVYALVEARPGSAKGKLTSTAIDCSDADAVRKARAAAAPLAAPESGTKTAAIPIPVCGSMFETTRIIGSGVTMSRLARALTSAAGRPVLDRTNLTGGFDIKLEWSPTPNESGDTVSVFTALQEELGLRLESTNAPLDVLVVERINRPSSN